MHAADMSGEQFISKVCRRVTIDWDGDIVPVERT